MILDRLSIGHVVNKKTKTYANSGNLIYVLNYVMYQGPLDLLILHSNFSYRYACISYNWCR
jgi:hypothetical protein